MTYMPQWGVDWLNSLLSLEEDSRRWWMPFTYRRTFIDRRVSPAKVTVETDRAYVIRPEFIPVLIGEWNRIAHIGAQSWEYLYEQINNEGEEVR